MNRTLSDLFSPTTITSGDVEGHSFFDSIVAPTITDPFAEVIQQNVPLTTEVSSGTAEPLSELHSLHEPIQPPLEPLMLKTQGAVQSKSQSESQSWQSEKAIPPLAPMPNQTSQVFDDPLNVSSKPVPSHPKPNLLEINSSQTSKPPSAPPTPDGEWVRSKQTEAERRHSAWICNQQTNQFLVTIGSGMLNPADVGQQFLTSPGLVIESPQVAHCFGYFSAFQKLLFVSLCVVLWVLFSVF